jgi:hypothetical protein
MPPACGVTGHPHQMSLPADLIALSVAFALASLSAQGSQLTDKAFIPFRDAVPAIDTARRSLPPELIGKTSGGLEAAWPEWARQRDTAIRARLERGDEDSIVYFWQFGTSFTTEPAVTERNVARLGGADAAASLLQRRLDDLVKAVSSPRADDRLRFVRQVLQRHRIDPATPAGVGQARAFLETLRRRVLAEYDEQRRTLEAAQSLDATTALAAFGTMFRDRGLSSDTSLLSSFAVEQALEAAKGQGLIKAGSVTRVAIVGPGLDVANKDEGYDFYPQQTIQPLGLMDSLLRLGLAGERELAVWTFDLSPRVNQHLAAALDRARAGREYVVYLPLHGEEPWNPELTAYWQRFGDRVGMETAAGAAPPGAGPVKVRAVRIAPARVATLVPRDINIVLERLDPLPADQRFDLIVATNILVYYGVFEQQLALANVASMLRRGGLFLTNTPVPPLPAMKLSERFTTVSYSPRLTDHLFWYEKQ